MSEIRLNDSFEKYGGDLKKAYIPIRTDNTLRHKRIEIKFPKEFSFDMYDVFIRFERKDYNENKFS